MNAETEVMPQADHVHADIEEVGPCKKLLTVRVSREGVDSKIDESYRELGTHAQLPGFRKGRSPRNILEKRFGKKVLEEVQKSMLDESLQTALKQNDFRMLGEPKFEDIQFEPGADMSFKATVEIRPKFDLPKYKGLAMDPLDTTVTEDEIQAELDRCRTQQGRFVPADRFTGEEDRLGCDVSLLDGGEVVWEKKNVSVFAPNGHVYGIPVDDLAKLLEGVEKEAKRSVSVEIPERFEEEALCGRKLELRLVVREIRSLQLPDLDDAFAQSLGLDNVDKLHHEIEHVLAHRKEMQSQRAATDKLLDDILAQTSFDLPEDLLKRFLEERRDRARVGLRQMGLSEDEIEKRIDAMRQDSRERIEKEVRSMFVMDEIAAKEGIDVTEQELYDRLRRMAVRYRMTSAQLEKQLIREGSFEHLYIEIREEKVRSFLLEHADDKKDSTEGDEKSEKEQEDEE